jgi:nicotinamidase-related amidase
MRLGGGEENVSHGEAYASSFLPPPSRDEAGLMLLSASRSQLMVSDMQARLVPAIADPERIIRRVATLLQAAGRLQVPVTVTEHYPEGLGPTIPEVTLALPPDSPILPKTTFGSLGAPAIAERVSALRSAGRDQILIAGLEAHVCVLQTALSLRAAGAEVFVVVDAVASRSAQDSRAATARLLHAGCHSVTTEMVVFEWLQRGGTEDFRALLPLLK